jgi:hypothetical protein
MYCKSEEDVISCPREFRKKEYKLKRVYCIVQAQLEQIYDWI